MRKNYFFTFLITIIFITPVYASLINEQALKNNYGPRLKGASIDIKYAFQRAKGRTWDQSTYNERKKFLSTWEEKVQQEIAEAQKIQLEEEKKLKEIKNAKLEKERILAKKARAEQQKARAIEKERIKNQRFQDKKKLEMQRSIQRLHNLDKKSRQQ